MTRLFEARPFLVTEVGSNHLGLSDCLESIAKAAKCGADACKFQLFDGAALYGRPDLAPKGSIDPLWLPKLREKADACGIELGVTAFSPELVKAVDPYVGWHKVASSDCAWPQMLDAVAATGKPIIISFGAHGVADTMAALQTLAHHGRAVGEHVVPMYCAAAYPSRRHEPYLLRDMQQAVGGPVGFSDHSQDVYSAPVVAAREFGAIVLEKHVTFIDADTPDRPHSLDADGFKLMVDTIRGKRVPTLGPSPEEKAMVLRHNRRLIATRDIAQGETLRYGENFGAYRSLEDDYRGLSPWAWEAVEGKRATKAIARGKGVGPGDFE